MELVFATHNPNKVREIQSMLPKHVKILSLKDIGCHEEIPETSETIDGNAILKANFVKSNFGYDCFADDTGLEVEALNGAPGVYSARFAGEEKDDEANIAKLLSELEEKPNRKAQFKTVIALNLENSEILFEGICRGRIIASKKGKNGFGYDPVFQPEGSEKTFAEMEMEEKSIFSHRGKAMRKLLDYLTE
ncbi:MAG TPA: non-canonical purine NTP diphosphatase [Salinimicrobium sp.]|nr:non-canonical purine NTP diphosphatase [Salinimicrobium sp.]